ncbi:phage major capsid protein [Microbacterium sp. SL75]|uniref:phage major capsid protein n=1 Tax=Microbacterium sp. SL75 TaxID=2995140 RepID=UPI0022721CB5|nr:phage major capsid protein [Microbacterium sp. SL75]WAC68902.1 phage major capsid protein [Microbacterium sp. SL75]
MTETMDALRTLREERQNLFLTEMAPLRDLAAQRSLSAEESEKWERVDREIGLRTARIDQVERAYEQERAFGAAPEARPDADRRENGLASELRGLLSADPTQRRANVSFTEAEFQRALSSGTATAGGNTIPTTFLNRLTEPLRDMSSVLQAGPTVIVTESGEELPWPTVSGHGSANANVGESDTRAGSDPTFGKTSIKAYEHSQLIVVPRRLIEDAAIDIEAFVARKIAENVGVSLAAKLAIGTGVNETQGLVTAATAGKTGATGVGGAATFDDVIDLFYSLAAPYRATPRSGFIVADAALPSLRKAKATGSGEYLWAPSVQVGQPDTLLGKAMYPDANMQFGLGKKSMVFGDVSKYIVRLVGSIEIARSEERYFESNQVAFRGILRGDGLLEDASAVKAFQGGAS